MMQLTTTAKATYIRLMIGNLMIIFSVYLLSHFFGYMNAKPLISPAIVHSTVKWVRVIKEKPPSTWPGLLSKKSIPWTKMTLSDTPLYQNNALLNLQPMIIFDLLKQHHKLQLSVFMKEGIWLNITMLPPAPNQLGVWMTEIALILLLLAMVLVINYWAVNTLNLPIQMLIQSLTYSRDHDQWLPIPLTGNPDQKLIFKKINELQEKVYQLLQNRMRIIAAISHDLRTPLTRLKLRTEYLEDSPHYDKMINDINEMEHMIRDTLDYFRDVNQEESPQRFDLISLLNSLCEDALDLNQKVQLETSIEKLVMVGHVNLLKRALSNVINNAVVYGHQATIRCEQSAKYVEISIQDQGAGLDPAELEHVLMPFYRTDFSRSRQTGGTGLGLTIAKDIVEKHQGTIRLMNRPEGGLQVLITLPIMSTP